MAFSDAQIGASYLLYAATIVDGSRRTYPRQPGLYEAHRHEGQVSAPIVDRKTGRRLFRRRIGCLLMPSARPSFPQEAKGLVELDIRINAVDGAGLHWTRPAEIVTANTAQPAFDRVFLNHIPDGPEIVGTIVVAAGNKQLLRLDRRGRLAFVVSEAKNMGRHPLI